MIASYQPNISNWILLHILLKYHYQNYFRTYDACAAAEGADTVLRQLHELEKLLSIQPVNGLPNYTLMLDGINEVQPDERSALLDEIERILNYAKEQGIDTLDTASLYGSSEEVLGRFNLEDFKVITKTIKVDKTLDRNENLNRFRDTFYSSQKKTWRY